MTQTIKARVLVTPRREVLDPQGDAVRLGLHSMGYDEVADVRVGRYVELSLTGSRADARDRVREMCERLLANGVIEDFSFTLDEAL